MIGARDGTRTRGLRRDRVSFPSVCVQLDLLIGLAKGVERTEHDSISAEYHVDAGSASRIVRPPLKLHKAADAGGIRWSLINRHLDHVIDRPAGCRAFV